MTARRGLAVPFLLAGVLACGPGSPESDDVAALADMLAGRALGSPDSVRVLVGRLPDRIPDLPELSPDFRILGSAEGPSSVRIHATTPLAPDSARSLLVARLEAGGWEPATGGFCHADGWELRAAMDPTSEPPLALRIDVVRASGSPCGPGPGAAERLRIDSLTPRLRPPSVRGDVELRCRGVSLIGTAHPIAGSLPADSLLARYGRQMRAAGWQEAEEPTASTAETWQRSADGDGTLTLTIAATGAPGAPNCLTLTQVRGWEW